MYFNRLDTFFKDQSSGKYRINGDVTEWVKVPFNEARYGRDSCGDIVCNNTWFLSVTAGPVDARTGSTTGMTMAQIQDYLKTFDKQDRYDFDDDGDFKEPDGYIDHMQIVHAGGDQSDGDPTYGTDAIWAHRWYAQIQPRSAPARPAAPRWAASRSARAASPTAARTCRSRTTRPASGSVTTPSSPRTAG